MEKSIYTMDLHDMIVVEDKSLHTTVLRVPGGWVYRSYDKEHSILSSAFVPFDNEMMSPPEQDEGK